MATVKAFISTNGLDPEVPYRDQLHLLSLEEKISLLSGVSFTSTAGVERLGIPSLKVIFTFSSAEG